MTTLRVENKALVLDLLEWVATKPRAYSEAMEVWQTSCPRLSIWEDTFELGFIAVGHPAIVRLTATGQEFLATERPRASPVRDSIT